MSAEFGTRIEGFAAFVERARRGGHEVREWTYIRKDGSRLTVLLAVTAVFDSEGRIDGFLGIATDVTERLRAEQRLRSSESRFRRLVDANIFGVVFGDIDGNISDANDAFLEMVGYTRQEMAEGRLPWDALVPPSLRALAPPVSGRAEAAGALHAVRAGVPAQGRSEPAGAPGSGAAR